MFTIDRVVGGEAEAVTDVTVTDGSRRDRAITFFAAPAIRAHLVE